MENGHIGQASGGSPRQEPEVAEIASPMLTLSCTSAVAVHRGPSRTTPILAEARSCAGGNHRSPARSLIRPVLAGLADSLQVKCQATQLRHAGRLSAPPAGERCLRTSQRARSRSRGPARCRAPIRPVACPEPSRTRGGLARCRGHRRRSRPASLLPGPDSSKAALIRTSCLAHLQALSSRLPSTSCRSWTSPAKARSGAIGRHRKAMPRSACTRSSTRSKPWMTGCRGTLAPGTPCAAAARARARCQSTWRRATPTCSSTSAASSVPVSGRCSATAAACDIAASGVLIAWARLPACVRARATTSALRSSTALKSSTSGCTSDGNRPPASLMCRREPPPRCAAAHAAAPGRCRPAPAQPRTAEPEQRPPVMPPVHR
jgi:hypothetical protein